MKLSVDLRKRNVWLPTLILGAILATLIIFEFIVTQDTNFLFIHMVLSIITLVAFMVNIWLPILFVGAIGTTFIISWHDHYYYKNPWGPSASFYKEDTMHIDTSVFILTLFAFIVFSYMYRPLEKRLPRAVKFLLAIVIIIIGLVTLPSNIDSLLNKIF